MRRDHDETDLDLTGLPALPTGWCWVTLSSIAKIDGGIPKDQQRQRTATMREVPYLRVANVQRGFLDLQEIKTILADASEVEGLRLQKGDILFTEGGDRDKLGRGWVWNDEIENCIHQNHIFRARPVPSIAEPKFVSFHGNFFGQGWFTRTGKQTTNLASINKGVLSRFPVSLAPLNEQRRIVAKIEELFSDLDAGVAALERAQANLKRYRAAVLKAAVEGKLTERWRAEHPHTEPASKLLARILAQRRAKWEATQLAKFAAVDKEPPKNWKAKYVEPKPPNMTGLPQLPESWCWVSVEQLGNVQLGRQRSPKNRSNKYPTKYIRAANLTEAGLDLGDVLDMEFQPRELETYRLHSGDILVSEASGSPDQVGKPVVWNGELDDCCFQNTVIRLRPEGMPSDYPLAVFRHYYWSKLFAKVSAGVGINHLSAAKFSALPFPLAPIAEQKQIVAEVEERLSATAVAERQIDASLLRAARLRQSILKQAFAGKLVRQDPHDEPASVLLERLRVERGELEGGRRPNQHKPKPPATLNLKDELRRQRNKRGLAAIVGKWPGDETDEEIQQALKELS